MPVLFLFLIAPEGPMYFFNLKMRVDFGNFMEMLLCFLIIVFANTNNGQLVMRKNITFVSCEELLALLLSPILKIVWILDYFGNLFLRVGKVICVTSS